jgi:hypothetical protein
MTVRALRAGLRVSEVPSFELPRRYGTSHLRAITDGWRVLVTLLGVRVRARGSKAPEAVERPVLTGASEPVGADGALAGVDLLAGGGPAL